MTRVVLVHLPEFPWSCIVRDETASRLPTLVALLEDGVSGALPPVGPAPLPDGVIATGQQPAKNGLLTRHTPRLDGYGQDLANTTDLQVPAIWEYLDAADIACALVNFRATNLAPLKNGYVVSDKYPEINSRSFDEWGVPPGAVSPIELLDELADLRLHPEDLCEELLRSLLAELDPEVDKLEEKVRILARILCENSTAHSAATQLLEKHTPEFLIVRYPALEQLAPHVPRPAPEHPDASKTAWRFLELLDSFIARLVQLAAKDTLFFITGGTENEPFWLAQGPGITQDQLLPTDTRLHDMAVTLLALFSIAPPSGMHGKIPQRFFNKRFIPPAADAPPLIPTGPPIKPVKQLIAELQNLGMDYAAPSRIQRDMLKRLRFQHYFMTGEAARGEGQLSAAIANYKNALEIIPDDAVAIMQLSYCFLGQKDVVNAKACLDSLPERSRQQFPISLLRIDIAIVEGCLEDMTGYTEQLLDAKHLNPQQRQALAARHKQIGEKYKTALNPVKAEWHLSQVIKLA